jgi:predicted Zn finger-like uncharacterized protein
MDVQCERCKTEYEFDDALVSERGTTVRCTQCGFQFKVRRPAAAGAAAGEDQWPVQRADGTEVVFTSLRDLQRAIMSAQVSRGDRLMRGANPRLLGEIAELEPFFLRRPASQPPPAAPGPVPGRSIEADPHEEVTTIARVPAEVLARSGLAAPARPIRTPSYGVESLRTVPGVGGAPAQAPAGLRSAVAPPPRAPTLIGQASAPPPIAESRERETETRGEARFGVRRANTMLGTGARGTPIPPVVSESTSPNERPTARPPATPEAAPAAPSKPPVASPPVSLWRSPADAELANLPTAPAAFPTASPPDAGAARIDTSPPPAILPSAPPRTHSSAPPPGVAPLASTMGPRAGEAFRGSYPEGETPAPGRASIISMLPASELEGPRRRRVGGWVVAGVLLLGVGVLGFVVGKPYLTALTSANEGALPLDPRATQFLADGERALIEGNLEAAKENFDKASALAENNPRVLLDVARLAAARADVSWLQLKLLPAEAKDDVAIARRSLEETGARARAAADAALQASPNDLAAVRAKIDALRLENQRDAARALVARVAADVGQPETAYVLAALDLSESEPLWGTVIDRLRIAGAGEGGMGRARAALVYALARSGDAAGARAELEKLASLPRPHPLLGNLRQFVERSAGAGGVAAGAGRTAAGKAEPTNAEAGAPVVDVSSLPQPTPQGGTAARGGAPAAATGDARVLLQQADAAARKSDWPRARTLYQQALEKNPGDSEALAGLGDVARAQRDNVGAASFYRRALSANPSYLPAMIGLGDVLWDSGDRAGAQRTYKDIVDRFPEGTYPPRAKERAAGGAGTGPSGGGGQTGATQGSGGGGTNAGGGGGSEPEPPPAPAPAPRDEP